MPAKPSLLPIAQLPAVLDEVFTATRDLQTAKNQLEQILNRGIRPPQETLKHLFGVYRSTSRAFRISGHNLKTGNPKR